MPSFLTTLRDTFDTIGVSQALEIRVLQYFLGGDARDVLSEQFSLDEVDFDGDYPETSEQGSWPRG